MFSSKIQMIALVFICAFLTFNASCKDKNITSDVGSKTGNLAVVQDETIATHPGIVTQDLDPKSRQIAEKSAWILDYTGESIITAPLELFRGLNNRYPNDIGELIDSGLLLAWPADQTTGKSLEVVGKIENSRDFFGKIAYIRKSDNEAYFEILDYTDNVDNFFIRKIPPDEIREQTDKTLDYMRNLGRDDILIAQNFKMNIRLLISSAFLRPEYRFDGKIPVDFAEAVRGNFFLIEQNLAPSFISDSQSEPLYIETGLGYLDGIPCSFEMSKGISITPSGKEFVRTDYSMIPLMDSIDLSPKDEDYARLTDKQYYYSTHLALNGTLNLPKSVLISRGEIIGQS